MQNLVWQLALGMLRHLCGVLFGMVGTLGYLTGNEVEMGSGATMTLAALAFSAYDKWKHHRLTPQATTSPQQTLTPPPPGDYFNTEAAPVAPPHPSQ